MPCKKPPFLLKTALVGFVWLLTQATAFAAPPDSTGTERRDGRVYVLHRVDRGQTLYSILRRYGSSLSEYQAANPDLGETIRPEQLLRVPYHRAQAGVEPPKPVAKSETASPEIRPVSRPQASSAPQPASMPVVVSRPVTHEVRGGETLYSISRRYGLAVADVKRWNNLPDAGGVQTGQVLMLSGTPAPKIPQKSAAEIAKDQLKTPSTPTSPRTEPVRSEQARNEATKPDPVPAKPEETAPVRREPEDPSPSEAVRSADAPVPNAGNIARHRRETGLAEVIGVDDKSGRYLGLHRTAPVGSMVTVRNEANNQSVLVKIIGKLPNTGLNERVIIKLSPGAFGRLSPVDRRFRAEVSYTSTN